MLIKLFVFSKNAARNVSAVSSKCFTEAKFFFFKNEARWHGARFIELAHRSSSFCR